MYSTMFHTWNLTYYGIVSPLHNISILYKRYIQELIHILTSLTTPDVGAEMRSAYTAQCLPSLSGKETSTCHLQCASIQIYLHAFSYGNARFPLNSNQAYLLHMHSQHWRYWTHLWAVIWMNHQIHAPGGSPTSLPLQSQQRLQLHGSRYRCINFTRVD